MRLLFVIGLALTLAGCHDMQPTPTGPSVVLVPSRFTVEATPAAVLLSGSTVTLRAIVRDANGTAIPDAVVRFATNTGSLSASEVRTGQGGEATATLTAASSGTVSATTIGGLAQVNTSISAVAPFSLVMGANSPVSTDGADITVQVIPTTALSAPPPTSVTLNCGSGATVLPGTSGTITGRCAFAQPGDYTVFATATAANGWTTAQNLRVTAVARTGPNGPTPFVLTLKITGPGDKLPDGTRPVSIAAIITPDWRLAASYEYDFGDGTTFTGRTVQDSQVTHYYSQGTKELRVAVRSTDGRTLTETARIQIAP